jgi:adenylylsulfate kinase-like enzyme
VAWYILRPTLQASRPSQTIAQMGPLSMSGVMCLAQAISGWQTWRRTSNKTLEKGFVREIFVVLLKMLFRRRDQLHRNEFVAIDGEREISKAWY